MKIASNIFTAGLLLAQFTSSSGQCVSPEISVDLGVGYDLQKIVMSGYDSPIVNRYVSLPGTGNMIVFKNFDYEPVVEFDYATSPAAVKVSAGTSCAPSGLPSISPRTSSTPTMIPTYSPSDAPVSSPVAAESAAAAVFGLTSWLMKSPLGVAASLLLSFSTFAYAESAAISIDIYTDVDALIHDDVGSMTCPPESFYWEHHPSVFGGYAGCVGEKYLLPCAQDAQGASDDALYSKYPINWNGTECVSTGYTFEDRTFWILWGDPLDKNELLTRTGLNPTVKFPLERGPYPAYADGTDETTYSYDDSSTAKAVAKDFLVYLGIITEAEKSEHYVSMTEGAEAGIGNLWAAKALEIARSTCNRDIYVLMEAPAYGYSNGKIAGWVNEYASSFYNSTECDCFPNCKDPTVTINNVGYFPPNLPSRVGGDGVTYAADSASPTSPWFESMVFPENPSGTIKIPQLPANRRVCDGVYVWPMYFYFNNFEIPIADKPDCEGWAYALTKGYSASVRAGFITYKKSSDAFVASLKNILSQRRTLMDGSFSEWSWMGQMQLQQKFMERPVDDPTSWVGAYGEIMKEKWDVIEDGFKDCPVLTLTNYGKGAYAWFLYKDPYLGLQSSSFISSFFLNVLGVKATTYYWGFRGADPSTFYGAGISTSDFTRMQLYRDLNVYIEVARRAKIVCADTTASVGDFLSIDDWKTAFTPTSRHRNLREEMPHLSENQHRMIEENKRMSDEMFEKSEACAPEYNTACLFQKIGTRFDDE